MVLLLLILIAYLVCALLAELEKGRDAIVPSRQACPCCGEAADVDWLLCPRCRTRLRDRCADCGQQRSLFHRYCPRCGSESAGRLE